MNKKLLIINAINILIVLILLTIPFILMDGINLNLYLNINLYIILSGVITLTFIIPKLLLIQYYDYNSYILFIPIAVSILSGFCYYLAKYLTMYETLYLLYWLLLIIGLILIFIGSYFFDKYFKKKRKSKPVFAKGGRK